MMTRRSFVRIAAWTALALSVARTSALADELVGRVTRVDVEAKKFFVIEKGTDKEIDLTVNDATIYATSKKEGKINLDKVQKRVEKSKKGFEVEVSHDKGVASRIKVLSKKKAEK